MAFWRRKKDQFVSLGLNVPPADEPLADPEPENLAPAAPAPPEPPPAVTPWQTSVLGLDL